MSEIAILIPCYNEGLTIYEVVRELRAALTYDATIYVYDNNSTDNTFERALEAGAIVQRSCVQGKGATVRQMLQDINADVYVMIDGDDTYSVGCVNKLIDSVLHGGYAMAIADRMSVNYSSVNTRRFHDFGNRLVRKLLQLRYHRFVPDVLTGFRAFSRQFAQALQIQFDGFELETEMTICALKNNFSICSVLTRYKERQDGSVSKVRTVRDGVRILNAIRVLR